MNKELSLNIVIIGLSITSSWGNEHATTYRGLVRELNKRGHEILFLEKDVPWYAQNRDLSSPDFCTARLNSDLPELELKYKDNIADADLVIIGSYVPQGVEVGNFVLSTAKGVPAFYDIDTPVTLAKLKRQNYEYISPELISAYDLYLSFTGGPTLNILENEFGSPSAKALYSMQVCMPEQYHERLQNPAVGFHLQK